ncbi:membrane-bound dehydrogenase domain protein [Fibrisoma limi BUZ 3]|uniref:Membrane-bound dehydrogenase domain protein n=1 Tax=Fibrisoma limi BUZ 3 TaxID=1185876 RepID=I2GLJ7_9BACT|nr:PVC-type heme-binding CxxCH protein [Fibrisoma limi]CCH54773.1 membrane-bound dehydrogenase domain protein [Fibrisoma limi BUZ 3]
MVKPALGTCLLGAGLLCLLSFKAKFGRLAGEDPSPPKTPAEELATFQLEPGMKIQLVAAEPMVQDPVVITFDEDGRLWVVEMRGFMPDIEGKGEELPVGRVSVLEDTNGDGRMDVSKVYLDSLIMPRALALIPGGALVVEDKKLWETKDLNGDGKADTKTLIDPTYAGSGLPEHSGNGLWRSMDNWYYNAKSRLRYRLVDNKPDAARPDVARWLRDSTEARGQWGISHDDKGRLVYNYNWSQLHADLVPPNYLSRNKNHTPTTGIDHGLTLDRRIYPIRPNPAVNRGYIPGTLDKDGRLLEFTAACSPLVYRGAAFPKAYYGNIFVCEPAGNLVKRNVVEEQGLLVAARDPHPGKEFLASTDERFRPVHMATGPDGALYVADMYRGLIQHGAYVTPYLKEQTIARNLVLPVNRGRIWRVVPESWTPQKSPKLSKASTEVLIQALSHPDGWYRDMAQRLLVERNDRQIGPALATVAQKGESELGRFHALWTLDGLTLSNPDLLLTLLTDKSPLVRTTAVRLLEPFAKTDKSIRAKFGERLLAEWDKAPIEQVLQMALAAAVLEPNAAQPLLAGIVERYGSMPLIRDAALSSLQHQEYAFLQRLMTAPDWQKQEPYKEIFVEMLATSIIRKRDAAELGSLLTRLDANKQTLGWQEKAVLTGLSIGGSDKKMKPVKLAVAPAILTRSAGKVDPARLASLAAVFEWPGHVAARAGTTRKSLLNDDEQKLFALGRQHYLSTCSGCHGTDGAGVNRFAPPLIGSDWVLGDEKRLALILLHGMEGPVDVAGKVYNAPEVLPVMPAHSTMDDATLTAILMYIRNEWGNNAGPVSRRTVGMTRVTSQGRVMPWTATELNKYILQARAEEAK